MVIPLPADIQAGLCARCFALVHAARQVSGRSGLNGLQWKLLDVKKRTLDESLGVRLLGLPQRVSRAETRPDEPVIRRSG